MSTDRPLAVPDALAMVQAGLTFLATSDPSAMPTEVQAEVLTGLERAEAQLTAARAQTLTAFSGSHGYAADGQFGPKPWLRAFTRVTRGAADGAMAWSRRLAAHPAVAAALATSDLSASWAREICGWTSKLPAERVADADAILLAAAAGGADLADLASLAWQMIERAQAEPDRDGGFADRSLWLETTLAGAGRLAGDLTPGCAAALGTVLDALSGKAGPEDTRSLAQRRHDALEEACQRLIGAGMLPGRDGQPLHLYAHVDLASLGGLATGSPLVDAPAFRPSGTGPGDWCPAGAEAAAAACDATVIPVVTGHPDEAGLDGLTDELARAEGEPLSPALRQRIRRLLLEQAVSLLSGPRGLAAQLRTHALGYPFNGRSQPLDLGTPTAIIPAPLRRAVTLRDHHCRFPGCTQPPSVCQVHHLRPRALDGPTSLNNLALLCRFHHLIAVHRWGWTLRWYPDGTTTATGPDGRTLGGHSPPRAA
jgi:hypothetical protein